MFDNDDKSHSVLTNDQLLDYIKKQKSRIKRLEKDALQRESSEKGQMNGISKHGNDSQSDNSSLFWGLIDRESPFKQRLAKSALNFLMGTISKSGLGRKCVASKRSLFDRWKEKTVNCKITAISNELTDLNKSFVTLEQKSSKLKALLARSHQSNQRFQEDTTSFKKTQVDAALQLKSLKERDESERMDLLETVRMRTIETAFQYDMELAIQRAADGMTQSQIMSEHTSQINPVSSSKRNSILEEENSNFKLKLETEEQKAQLHIEENKTLKKAVAKLEKDMLSYEENVSSLRKKISTLEYLIAEDDRLRMDLELELELVTRGRGDMIRNMELNSREKFAAETELLKREVAQLREIPEQDPRSSSVSNSGNSNAALELEIANRKIEELKATIKTLEMRNKASTSSFLRAYTSSSSLSPGILGTIPKNVPQNTLNSSNGHWKQGSVRIKQGGSSSTGTGAGTPTKLETRLVRGSSGSGNGHFKLSDEEEKLDPQEYTTDQDSITRSLQSSLEEFTTYACESLILKAGNDFRLKIIIPENKSFRIKWEFSVFYVRKKTKNTAPPSSTSAADIGFSIIENLSNGSLPQLITYSRASGVTKKVAEWRLDQNEEENSQRRRRGSNSSDVITVPLGDDALLGVLEGSMNNGDNRNGESYSNGIKEGDKIEEYSAESSMNTELSLNKPASNHNNTLNEGIISDMKNDQIQEGESSSINTSVSTSTRTTAMRTLIVLFDNTYSWYQPKELKYSITVEILP